MSHGLSGGCRQEEIEVVPNSSLLAVQPSILSVCVSPGEILLLLHKLVVSSTDKRCLCMNITGDRLIC